MSADYLDLPTFGARLRWARERKGISAQKLAPQVERGGRHTIQRWQNNENEPSLAQISQLADILGVNRTWLAFGDGEPFVLPAIEAFLNSKDGKQLPREQVELLRQFSHSLFPTNSPTNEQVKIVLSLVDYVIRPKRQHVNGDAKGENA